MQQISVVIPTVTGREDSLERCVQGYVRHTQGFDLEILIYRDRPSCGDAWMEGGEQASGDYLHFSADDLYPHPGWAPPLIDAVERDIYPCPVLMKPTGQVESFGGTDYALNTEPLADWEPVGFAPVPFMPRLWWNYIRPFPSDFHYCTDVMCSEVLRQHGIPTEMRVDSKFTHYHEMEKRGAGMTQDQRAFLDQMKFRQTMQERFARS